MITFRMAKKGDETQVLEVIQDVLSAYGLQQELDGADVDVAKALPLYKKYGFVEDTGEKVCSRCDFAMKRSLK